MTDNIPSPEATDAAGVLLNKLDADHITEIRAASWLHATYVLARALDEFARQAVERAVREQRERHNAYINGLMLRGKLQP